MNLYPNYIDELQKTLDAIQHANQLPRNTNDTQYAKNLRPRFLTVSSKCYMQALMTSMHFA